MRQREKPSPVANWKAVFEKIVSLWTYVINTLNEQILLNGIRTVVKEFPNILGVETFPP